MNKLNPLAIKDVTPYVVTDPRGIDMVCKSIQEQLTSLTWLEKSFARAVFRSKLKEGEEYLFPAIFVEEGYDYLNLLELDNWSSYSFMIARDSETIDDYQEGQQNTISRRLSLIVWANLNEVDDTREDDFLEELKQDVINNIKYTRFTYLTNGANVLGFNIAEIYDEPKRVFEDFSYSTTKTQGLYYPYRGFRIELDCYYTEECLS